MGRVLVPGDTGECEMGGVQDERLRFEENLR